MRRRGARCALLLAALTGAAAFASAAAAAEQRPAQTSSSLATAADDQPPPTEDCDLSVAPVCGRNDGQWYQNACLARSAGAAWREGDHAPCAARPSPFTSGKPGPWGAEADDGGPAPPVKRDVLTAFKAEGFRYLGRIRLARELDLVSRASSAGAGAGGGATGSSALLAAMLGGAPHALQAGGGNSSLSGDDGAAGWWVPPPKDADGNWIVEAVRCTVEGDMYAGKMAIDGNAPLTVVDAVRPGGGGFGGGAGGGVKAAAAAAAKAKAAAGEQAARLKVAAGSGAAAAVEEAAEALELAAEQVQQQQQRQQQAGEGGGSKRGGSSKTALPPSAFASGIAKALEDGKGVATEWWASVKTAFAQGVAKGRATAVASAKPSPQQAADAAAAATTTTGGGGRSLLAHSQDDQIQVQKQVLRDEEEQEEEPSEMTDARRAAEAAGSSEAALRATPRRSRPGGRRAAAHHSRSLSGIVGSDERFPCSPRKWPFTAIGQIEVLDDSGVYICTGTLIAPDKVVTAGHCVWNSKRGAFYFNLSFSPGRYRTEDGRKVDPWGTVPWSSVTVFDQFKKDPTQWDVAVVTLAQPIGEQAGTMGLAAGCAKNARLWVSGYPQERAEGTCMTATCLDPVLDCNAQLNAHTCDTTSGMSGAPMFDSKYRVRMLHVAGVEGKQENRATTVSDFLISTVMKW